MSLSKTVSILFFMFSTHVFAESKVVCAQEFSGKRMDVGSTENILNDKISELAKRGLTNVSAPTLIASKGYSVTICVTVSSAVKPY